jgi:sterol desaturase/sphingolipid hydroxylase (fatty acid hydroxylase superfamily)
VKGLQALVAVGLFLASLEFFDPGVLHKIINPFGLSLAWLTPILVLLGPLDHLRYHIIQAVIDPFFAKLPLRQKVPELKGLASMEAIDYIYMAINNVFLMAPFAMHMVHFAVYPPSGVEVVWSIEDARVSNTLVPLTVIFVVSDFYYYWLHRAMHYRPVYPYIHKHHHRQNLPERGFADAINEHPIEQFCGMVTLWSALYTTARITPVHTVVPVVFFLSLSALSVANHTDLDIKIPFVLDLGYSVRAHETHHRFPDSNLAQYFMGFDKFWGTYRPYSEGKYASAFK